jgi:hypothetical protein
MKRPGVFLGLQNISSSQIYFSLSDCHGSWVFCTYKGRYPSNFVLAFRVEKGAKAPGNDGHNNLKPPAWGS